MIVFGLLAVILAILAVGTSAIELLAGLPEMLSIAVLVLLVIAGVGLHYLIRKWWANRLIKQLLKRKAEPGLVAAIRKNLRFRHSLFRVRPVGWGGRSRKQLERVRESADDFVQELNDRFTNPSGESVSPDNQSEPSVPISNVEG